MNSILPLPCAYATPLTNKKQLGLLIWMMPSVLSFLWAKAANTINLSSTFAPPKQNMRFKQWHTCVWINKLFWKGICQKIARLRTVHIHLPIALYPKSQHEEFKFFYQQHCISTKIIKDRKKAKCLLWLHNYLNGKMHA